MQSCLFFESADRTEALALLRTLTADSALSALRDLRLITCLTVESAYPAETLRPLLAPLGGKLTDTLSLREDMRCVSLPDEPDEGRAMLLRAAGIDAAVRQSRIIVLCGLDEAQYRIARARLLPPTAQDHAPRTLSAAAVADFIALSDDRLDGWGAARGLALPAACLSIIADHYRALGREPQPEELLILDEAYRAALTDPAACAPVEFLTSDARLPTVYADLMAKRAIVTPGADAPATLQELADTASAYLCAHRGAAVPPVQTADSPARLAGFGGAAMGGFGTPAGQTKVCLSASPCPAASVMPDDRLLLVLSSGRSETAFADRLSRLCASPALAGKIRRSLPVPAGRLIGVLGKMLGGSGLGLAITPPPAGMGLMAHLTPDTDAILLACAPGSGPAMTNALRTLGFSYRLIAAVQKKPQITLENAPERLCFPAAMLAPRPAIYAQINTPTPEEVPADRPPLPLMLASLASPALSGRLGFDPIAAAQLAASPADVMLCGEKLLCADTVRPGEDPFAAVRDCALALIARLCAAGVSPQAVTLSLSAELPLAGRSDCGRAIAALLGLHCVEIELGIPAAPADLRPGHTLAVTVSAYAPAPQTSTASLRADTTLWLLVPRSPEPHLRGERALLALADAMRKADHSIFATGMLAPSAAAAAAASAAHLGLILTAPADALNTVFPCGFLLAAPELPALPEGVAAIALGQTTVGDGVTLGEETVSTDQLRAAFCAGLPAAIPPLYRTVAPPRISAHRVMRPRVLIPYADRIPTALAAAISAQGGEPLLCAIDLRSATAARQSLSAFADRLEQAQILLLSGNRAFVTALFGQRRTVEALSAMRRRDGLICAWDEAFAAMLNLGYFSADGSAIPSAPCTGIRMLSSITVSAASPWIDPSMLGRRAVHLFADTPQCPVISPEARTALAAEGRIIAAAEETHNGQMAILALCSADGGLLGMALPPTKAMLGTGIGYFL